MIAKNELMTLTVAQPKPNSSLTEGSCCTFVAHPNGWVDPFWVLLIISEPISQMILNGNQDFD
ncbi:MAG: hypothetical protein ACYS3N_11850 [Planctomycetota bacterium]|jgi:hypothetical protein